MLGYIVNGGVRTVTYSVVNLAANRSDLLAVVVRPALSISACQQSGSKKNKNNHGWDAYMCQLASKGAIAT